MKFQKILSLGSLIYAAVMFVFALSFLTGDMAKLTHAYTDRHMSGMGVSAQSCIDLGQTFVTVMEIFAIICVVACAVVYITSTNSRRNYYITNYVVSIAVSAVFAITALAGIILTIVVMSSYNSLDWTLLMQVSDMYESLDRTDAVLSGSQVTFILSFIVYLLSICVALLWVYNLIWKIKLMKGEKALLEGSFVQEAA